MRNATLAACIILFGSSLHAQFSPGSKLISGNVNFTSLSSSTNVTPGLVQHNIFIGIDVSKMRFRSATTLTGFGVLGSVSSYGTTGPNPGDDYTSRGYTTGAFFNAVKLEPLAAKFYLALTGLAGANYNFGRVDNNTTTRYDRFRAYTAYISGALGIWYRMHNRLVLSCDLNNLATLSFNHSKWENRTGPTVASGSLNTVGLRSGLSGFSLNGLSFGIRYLLK
jgi:hypothetical protein